MSHYSPDEFINNSAEITALPSAASSEPTHAAQVVEEIKHAATGWTGGKHENISASPNTAQETKIIDQEKAEDRARIAWRSVHKALAESTNLFNRFFDDYTPAKHEALKTHISEELKNTTNEIHQTAKLIDETQIHFKEVDQDTKDAKRLNEKVNELDKWTQENPELRHTAGAEMSEKKAQIFAYFKKHNIDITNLTKEEGIEKLGELRDQIANNLEILNVKLDKLNEQFSKFDGLQEYLLATPFDKISKEKLIELGLTEEDIKNLEEKIPDITNRNEIKTAQSYWEKAYKETGILTDYLKSDLPEKDISLKGMQEHGLDTVVEARQNLSSINPNDSQSIYYTGPSPKYSFSIAAQQQPNNMSVAHSAPPQMTQVSPANIELAKEQLNISTPITTIPQAPIPAPGM